MMLRTSLPGIHQQIPISGRMPYSTKRAIKERFVHTSYQYVVAGRSQDVRLVNVMCHLRTIGPSVRQPPFRRHDRRWPGADREEGASAGREPLRMRHCATASDEAAENPGLGPKMRFSPWHNGRIYV